VDRVRWVFPNQRLNDLTTQLFNHIHLWFHFLGGVCFLLVSICVYLRSSAVSFCGFILWVVVRGF